MQKIPLLNKLKFFDECGLELPFHGKRLNGHAPVGERCIELLRYAWFNCTCYHAPPGIPPGICNFVFIWRSIPHPRARRKRQFPTPGAPHRPQIRCFVYKA